MARFFFISVYFCLFSSPGTVIATHVIRDDYTTKDIRADTVKFVAHGSNEGIIEDEKAGGERTENESTATEMFTRNLFIS